MSKLYPSPLKHHKFVKKEAENLLEAGLIKRSVSPYAAPILVVPRKSKPGTPLVENKEASYRLQRVEQIDSQSTDDPSKIER